MMNPLQFILVIYLTISTYFPLAEAEGIHFPLHRRDGRFSRHEAANLTYRTQILQEVEFRHSLTTREVHGNHLKRQWLINHGDDENDPNLIDVAGHSNRWYTYVEIGEPPQKLEVDIDMLSPDFYTVLTTSTSEQQSKYDTFASTAHIPNDERVHSICQNPSDVFHLPPSNTHNQQTIRLHLPICTPSKSSRQTLARSGTILGLSPSTSTSDSLTRLSSPSLLSQLFESGLIKNKVFSITLLDAETGILSLGGTIAREAEQAKIRSEIELRHFGEPIATPDWVADQVEKQMAVAMPETLAWDEHFKWMDVRGAEGWWSGLMPGVWVNGVKVLRAQPILIDINTPFIHAPHAAVTQLYSSIPGSHRLPHPHTRFHAYPCLNTPSIVLELGGWNFPLAIGPGTTTAIEAMYGPDGGAFSLGKEVVGSGYCVGRVVESDFVDGAAGLAETWILGELAFTGLGLVFDEDRARVGFRSY